METLHFLAAHPDQEMIQFFLQGLATGFKVGFAYHHASLKPAKKNLRSAMEHPDVVQEYLENEIREKRVIGPFDKGTIPLAQVNRFGVIPKSHQPHKWRLIVDLSYPRGNSVNDGVPKDLCSMVYVTIDDAISKILELGPEALLAKIDIKSAFRLIPVHPADRHLLAMEWEGKVLIDTCLPFGLRSAPKLFNIMADLLAWILDVQGVSYLIRTGQKRYLSFCSAAAKPPLPASEETLLMFVSQLAKEGLAPQSIKGYLSAVRNLRITTGLHEEFSKELTPKLEIVLRGIKKQAAKTRPPHVRLPITIEVMAKIKEVLQKDSSNEVNICWAACALAFLAS